MRKYIKVILKVIWLIIYSYFAWLLIYSLHPEKIPFEKRFKKVQTLIRKVLKAFGVSYDLINYNAYKESIKNDKCILYISNHISFIDPLVLIAVSEVPFSIVAKKETKKMIVVGRIITILDGEFIDRDDLKQQLKCFINVQKNMKEKNRSYAIYPEGTRNDSYELNQYHYGSFKPAHKLGKPICVMAIGGSQKVLSLDNHRHYPITVKFLERIDNHTYANKSTIQIAEYVQKITQENLLEIKERNEALFKSYNKIKTKK